MIGGTACSLAFEVVGLPFRSTKDLDVVLCIESCDESFAKIFWSFITQGKYEIQEHSSKREFYRFKKPQDEKFPWMIELFSRVPDALNITSESQLTPIPFDGDISSLSAIILDNSYYQWIKSGKSIISGVPIVVPEHLIPLKAKAWLDLRERKHNGDTIDNKDIKKHKNDVFRLFNIVNPEFRAELQDSIKIDMDKFLLEITKEEGNLKQFGLASFSVNDIIETLKKLYGLR